LGYHPLEKRVVLATCANQDPLSIQGLIPLLGSDVWEHAYYLQYKNARAEYVKNIWKVIDWRYVEERFLEVAR
jgi:superoxide dismutase, Fe-Mn family